MFNILKFCVGKEENVSITSLFIHRASAQINLSKCLICELLMLNINFIIEYLKVITIGKNTELI